MAHGRNSTVPRLPSTHSIWADADGLPVVSDDPSEARQAVYSAWNLFRRVVRRDLSEASARTRARCRSLAREALTVCPWFDEGWALLAAMEQDEGELASARDTLAYALRINPHNHYAQDLLDRMDATVGSDAPPSCWDDPEPTTDDIRAISDGVVELLDPESSPSSSAKPERP